MAFADRDCLKSDTCRLTLFVSETRYSEYCWVLGDGGHLLQVSVIFFKNLSSHTNYPVAADPGYPVLCEARNKFAVMFFDNLADSFSENLVLKNE